jgi:hypothetical protein
MVATKPWWLLIMEQRLLASWLTKRLRDAREWNITTTHK